MIEQHHRPAGSPRAVAARAAIDSERLDAVDELLARAARPCRAVRRRARRACSASPSVTTTADEPA